MVNLRNRGGLFEMVAGMLRDRLLKGERYNQWCECVKLGLIDDEMLSRVCVFVAHRVTDYDGCSNAP